MSAATYAPWNVTIDATGRMLYSRVSSCSSCCRLPLSNTLTTLSASRACDRECTAPTTTELAPLPRTFPMASSS